MGNGCLTFCLIIYFSINLFAYSLPSYLKLVTLSNALHRNYFPFQVPLVPFLPAFSMFACIVLLVSTATLMNWVGCFVVFAVGKESTVLFLVEFSGCSCKKKL